MAESPERLHLRRQLEAHLTELGYSRTRLRPPGSPVAEISRISMLRGRIAYGETVLHDDLQRPGCHERLLFFSQRRTRRRSSILLFIGVDEADEDEVEALLERLEIRSRKRGGHVHVVPIPAPELKRRRATQHRKRE